MQARDVTARRLAKKVAIGTMITLLSRFRARVRQYGILASARQVASALTRHVYRCEANLAFVISDFRGQEYQDPSIQALEQERVDQAANAGQLTTTDVRLLTGFVDQGCRGVYAEVDGRLAGYAWVQYEGEYRFGGSGRVTIPPKYTFVKNLFVYPEFRGRKLGQKLNAARLAMIPPGHTPVVFIIPENRIAIRNWEKHGFQRIAEVKNSHWIGGCWRTRVKRLSELSEADELIRAIEKANRG